MSNLFKAPAAFAVMALTFILALIAFRYTTRMVESNAKVLFYEETRDAEVAIQRHIQAYIDALYGMQSLFAVQDNISREEWKTYIESLGLLKRYPGIEGASFIRYLRNADKGAYENRPNEYASARARKIRPAGERTDYLVVDYDEPRGLLGFDIGSESMRRQAAERARDTGEPTATGPISFLNEQGESVGFLMLAPVYRSGAPHRNLEE
ncbi:MAG TPA: CHASE domain-containing protein, partial [Candidatus Manganitrophaceae bacterium]|nr:CHASE domain-containing protein [Candidatus Manganitrophaceae bacterium]